MKKISLIIIAFMLLAGQTALAKKSKSIEVIGGTPIPGFGIAIDASYDKRLDNFVPGYKVLNVAIVNDSFDLIEMNPEKDKWWVQLKDSKKKHEAVSDLRGDDPEAWHKVPLQARGLITYPLVLPIGARQVIDLFVPSDISLENFTKLIVRINSLGATFVIIPRQ